jgi:hypothetical protein
MRDIRLGNLKKVGYISTSKILLKGYGVVSPDSKGFGVVFPDSKGFGVVFSDSLEVFTSKPKFTSFLAARQR